MRILYSMNWIREKTDSRSRGRYLLILTLTALGGYGYKITHTGIGIDDTPYEMYFEDGLAVIVGRWVMFLLNKIVHIAEYTPYLTELAAVLILMVAVTVWMLLFRGVLGKRVPEWGYLFFACIFLSCPLISEVFTYYLHNGVATGYLLSGLSLWQLREGWLRLETGERRAFGNLAGALALLVAAIGCYESFMIVWLVGMLLLLWLERMSGNRCRAARRILIAVGAAAAGMVLRSLVIAGITAVFHIEGLESVAEERSIVEMLAWIQEPDALSDFAMVLKRLFVMYSVFGCAYYPIRIFVLAAAVMVLCGLVKAIRSCDMWIPVLLLGAFMSCFLLAVLEGSETLYRSAQFLPLICGTGALVFAWTARGTARRLRRIAEGGGSRAFTIGSRAVNGLAIFLLSVILWNQCVDLNHWFYIDYSKYEYSVNYVREIAYELEKNYDTSKPVYFVGDFQLPQSIIGDAYVELGSETYFKMKSVTDLVDEHLLEKFYRDYGVWVAQTPSLSVINWGKNAFSGSTQLVKFFAMHGYEIQPWTDDEQYTELEGDAYTMPSFPAEGSIVDCGEYIVVKL